MKLRLALIAMLVMSSVAGADEGQGARRAHRAPSAPEAPVPPALPTLTIRAVTPGAGGRVHTDTLVVVPLRARLELENFSGDIAVLGWDQSRMRIEAEHAEGTHVGVKVGAATVVVRAKRFLRIPGLSGRGRARDEDIDVPTRVNYRLTVPRGMSLRLSGINTAILVDGVTSDVSAESVNGSVWVRGGRGDVKAVTINGGVQVVGTRGSVEASSVNSGIQLWDVEGPVRAETVRGDLALYRVLSEAVEASTVSGALRYEGSIQPGGEYHFESHSGDVTVVLPDRPDVAVTVSTYSGGFASSFPIQSSSTLTSVRDRGREFDFTLGDGRAELDLESFSGLIRLARAGEAAGQPPRFEIRRDK